MASFTESATLLLRDKSSANINKINASLKRLFATAQKMRKMNLGLDTKKLSQAQTKIKGISRDISNLQRRRINIQANTAQLTRAQQQLARIRAQAARPITQRINTVNTGGGGRGPGGLPVGRGRASGGSGSRQGMNFDWGFGGALMAFTGAVQLATQALRALADAAVTRDRTNLQLAAGATKVQTEIIKEGAKGIPEGVGAIQFTDSERAKFAQSLLGDIAPPAGKTGVEAQKWRAETALKLAAVLERDVLPRQYAMNPEQSIEQSQEGLRQIVKTMNLASAELVDSSGNMTADSTRVLNAIQLAMAADPDIDPQLINTTARGLKTRAYGLSEKDLATVFMNAGARGQRAGMELYRAMKSLTGNVDNANLNEQLLEAGIITGVDRKKKGGIIPGTGEMVNEDLFETDFSAWVMDTITMPMNKALAEEAGVNISEVDKIANVQAKKISYLEKKFAAMPQNALQAVSDYVLGEKQQQAALQQAKDVMGEPISEDIAASWKAQMDSVTVGMQNAAETMMDAAMTQLNAAEFFRSMAGGLSDQALIESGQIDKLSPEKQKIIEESEATRKKINDWFKNLFSIEAQAGEAAPATAAEAVALAASKTTLSENKAKKAAAEKALANQERMQAHYKARGFGESATYTNAIAKLSADIAGLNAVITKQTTDDINRQKATREKQQVTDIEQPVIDKLNADIAELNERSVKAGDELDRVQAERKTYLEQTGTVAPVLEIERAALQDELGTLNDTIRSLNKELAFRKSEQKRALAEAPKPAAQKMLEEDRATRGREARDAKSTAEQKAAFKKWSEGKSMAQVSKEMGGKEEVMKWQRQIGAFVDGIFGPQSLAKLQAYQTEERMKRIEELSKIKDETAPVRDKLAGAGGEAGVIGGAGEDPAAKLTASIDTGTNLISTAFNTGTTGIATAGASAAVSIQSGMTTGGASAGQTIASAMIGAASSVGNTIAAAVRNGVAGLSIPVSGAAPTADPGAMAMA